MEMIQQEPRIDQSIGQNHFVKAFLPPNYLALAAAVVAIESTDSEAKAA